MDSYHVPINMYYVGGWFNIFLQIGSYIIGATGAFMFEPGEGSKTPVSTNG